MGDESMHRPHRKLRLVNTATYSSRNTATIVFIDAKGKERPELRAVQFIDKDEFLRRLSAVDRS